MNERIKWIAVNAGFDLGRDWEVIGLCEDSLKTYTELIVKECASICYNSKLKDGDAHAQNLLYEFNIDGARDEK